MKLIIPRVLARTLLISVLIAVLIASAISAIPEGVNQLSQGARETRTAPVPVNVTADGGNVSNINITMLTQTEVWQGFYGEVNGSFVLDDASGDRFYSWNLSNTSGEIYASRNNSINFANTDPMNNCSQDNALTTGHARSDSVNNTYTASSNRAVTVGIILINASTSCATYTYVNSTSQSAFFHNIILTDSVRQDGGAKNISAGGNTTIYVALIETNIAGYDTQTHDYQILLPVNRSTGLTTYAFYAELNS